MFSQTDLGRVLEGVDGAALDLALAVLTGAEALAAVFLAAVLLAAVLFAAVLLVGCGAAF